MTRERARRQGSKEAGEQADRGGKGIGGQVEMWRRKCVSMWMGVIYR